MHSLLLIICHTALDPAKFVLPRTSEIIEKFVGFAPVRLLYLVTSRSLAYPVKYESLTGLNVPLKHCYAL